MAFIFKQMDIPGVTLIEPKIFFDERGYFLETFKMSDFKEFGIPSNFLQDNYSKSQKNVLRGLHYQANPKAQGKFVYVLQGSIFDVVVDLRLGSPTFKQWRSVILDDQKHNMLWVPPGLAHGFCVLSSSANVVYKCTEYYAPTTERGVQWNDPDLNISWPLENPLISPKDAVYPSINNLSEVDLVRYNQ